MVVLLAADSEYCPLYCLPLALCAVIHSNLPRLISALPFRFLKKFFGVCLQTMNSVKLAVKLLV